MTAPSPASGWSPFTACSIGSPSCSPSADRSPYARVSCPQGGGLAPERSMLHLKGALWNLKVQSWNLKVLLRNLKGLRWNLKELRWNLKGPPWNLRGCGGT